MEYKDIKVGMKLVKRVDHGWSERYELVTVERVTPTGIFRLSDGSAIRNRGMDTWRYEEVTPEAVSRAKLFNARKRMRTVDMRDFAENAPAESVLEVLRLLSEWRESKEKKGGAS